MKVAYVDLTLTTKGEVKIEPSYYGNVHVTVDNVDIDDVIAEIGFSELFDHMDIDEIVSALESKGYKVNDED